MFERFGQRLVGSVLVWDVLVTLVCLQGATLVRLQLDFGQDIPLQNAQLPWELYFAIVVIWTVIFLLLTPQRALFNAGLVEAIGRLLASVALASLTFAGLLYISFRDVSRLQFIYFVALNLAALILLHLFIRSYMLFRRRSGWQRRVLIVGGGILTQQLADELARRPWTGMTVIGYTGETSQEAQVYPCLGTVAETPTIVANHQVDEVIFTLPPNQQDQIVRISLQLQQQPVMIHTVPGIIDLTFNRTSVENIGGIPLISLRESALTETQRLLKRLFDIVASSMLLLLLSPLMLIIALLIKVESAGSIFFFQERIGEQGQRFKMIKFRSMYQDAERRWHEVAQRDSEGRLIHKSVDDPRITNIGRKLRRTSLDELPQLINVLKGEMSLVGPRPEMPYIAAEYEPWQWQRFRVPPGMTGWWQVNGRSDKPMHLNTEDDLYYIQNYSFWLDMRILFRTFAVVVYGNGAY